MKSSRAKLHLNKRGVLISGRAQLLFVSYKQPFSREQHLNIYKSH